MCRTGHCNHVVEFSIRDTLALDPSAHDIDRTLESSAFLPFVLNTTVYQRVPRATFGHLRLDKICGDNSI